MPELVITPEITEFVDFVEEAIFRWKNDPSARTARHLVFAWFYSMIEPPFLTKVTGEITESLRPVADEARSFLAEAADLGTLLVLAYVHWSTPWAFGPSDEHEHARSRAFLLRAADVVNDEELRAAIIERQNDGCAGLGDHSPGVARQVGLLFSGTSPYDEYFLHVLGGTTHQP